MPYKMQSAIFLVTGVAVVLATTPPCQAGQKRQMFLRCYNHSLYNSSSGYSGEVIAGNPARPDGPGGDIGPCCEAGYCADGQGNYGTDGGETYMGDFVMGFPSGHGTFGDDWFTYVGDFKNGTFHGHGIITCSGDSEPYYEGPFVYGKMKNGRSVLYTRLCDF